MRCHALIAVLLISGLWTPNARCDEDDDLDLLPGGGENAGIYWPAAGQWFVRADDG